MAAQTELQIRKRLLSNFMDYDPLYLDLTRPIMTKTNSGGYVQTGSLVISNQKFYFVPFFRRLTDEINRNPQSYGEDRVRDVDYILIFIPGETDVKEGDLFTMTGSSLLGDGDYRVHFVSKRKWDREQAVVRLRS